MRSWLLMAAGTVSAEGASKHKDTSAGAASAAGSRYSSRAQPESLSKEEVGVRPASVPLQGALSLWGHVGLSRDIGRKQELKESCGFLGSPPSSAGAQICFAQTPRGL